MPDVGTIRSVNHGAYLEAWDGEAWVLLVWGRHDERFENPLARVDQWLQADRPEREPDAQKRRYLEARLNPGPGVPIRT